MFAQFMRKQDFVYDFEDALSEPTMQAISSVNDHSRDFVLFHRVKRALLLPAGEAKNFGPIVSLRRASATQSEKFFTLRRKGAKKASESKNPVSSLGLGGFAPLRETSGTQGDHAFFTQRREGPKDAENGRNLWPR